MSPSRTTEGFFPRSLDTPHFTVSVAALMFRSQEFALPCLPIYDMALPGDRAVGEAHASLQSELHTT